MGKVKYEKFKHCSLPYPFFDKVKNIFYWLYYDKKKRKFHIENNLQYALEDFAHIGMLYHYQANICSNRKNERPIYKITIGHSRSFEDVIKALYDHPDTFVIPKEYIGEYSKQELEYLKQLQNYFHVIGLKDEKRSSKLNEVSIQLNELYYKKRSLKRKKYEKLEEKLMEQERISRLINSKASLYSHYQNMYEEKESVIQSFLHEDRDYRIYRSRFKKFSKAGECYFLIDKNANYRAILDFVSEEELKFRDLTEDMVDYKSSGFKNFKDYKNDLYQKFVEDSKWYKESFNENSTILYVKFKLAEIIENNRTK